ncbi:hypothetical protein [Sphingomonas mollis]|uniref:AsnC family protein n=1 Tax=Sphingomonas mollis TaxID=2795726 RepID=A0ABS0XPJ0_9SPHN|nr:hypothetical protein [Sphingomonas sp. BT553]MBJ6121960.1 hypothetical protein [Sphingomonas sp. BT553]
MPDDPPAGRRPPRRWSEDDDVELRRRIASRQPIGDIARGLNRTVDGIRGRAATLRLRLPGRNRPWRVNGGTDPDGEN